MSAPPPVVLPPPPSASRPPSSTPPAASPPVRPPAKSHQSGVIEQHWNDLPTGFLPSSRGASRAASPLPPTEPPSNSTTPPPANDPSEFKELLPRLFEDSPSSLKPIERKAYFAKLKKAEATMTDGQRAELAGIVSKVLDGSESQTWGRERIVEFMTREKDVAAWATGLRRGLECVIAAE